MPAAACAPVVPSANISPTVRPAAPPPAAAALLPIRAGMPTLASPPVAATAPMTPRVVRIAFFLPIIETAPAEARSVRPMTDLQVAPRSQQLQDRPPRHTRP